MGLAAACALRRRGHAVTLLDRAQPGQANSASWASAGIVGATLDDAQDPRAELRQLSRQLWPTFAAELQAASGLDPEYRETGCLQLAESDDELRLLARHAEPDAELNPQAGRTVLLDQQQLRELEPAV